MTQGQTLYRLWRYQTDEFRRYERTQGKRQFEVGDFVASFVVDPAGAAVFAGLSSVLGVEPNADPVHFEFLGESYPPGKLYEYDLELDERFAEYEGRLVIDWGPGTRSWCQRAHLQHKPIVEIRRTVLDVEWRGFMNVLITEREVMGLAPNWQSNLSAANGVYLLTCAETGNST